jgi:hypothetical protein
VHHRAAVKSGDIVWDDLSSVDSSTRVGQNSTPSLLA